MIWEKRVGGKYYTPHLMQDIYLPNFAIAIARCRKKASFGFVSASCVVHLLLLYSAMLPVTLLWMSLKASRLERRVYDESPSGILSCRLSFLLILPMRTRLSLTIRII
ncbi:hypothetical protein H0G86_010836 [Trichoderma simmonsii]|uniref:Uncharacterized protein n=1 Tax=Trichoderma simmonsii TaxID=1491479 RepID=A0A8G0PJQ4_9HYPO|nr:hypothetical protein H0G86_010836 [Trichoderma simmonsii]